MEFLVEALKEGLVEAYVGGRLFSRLPSGQWTLGDVLGAADRAKALALAITPLPLGPC